MSQDTTLDLSSLFAQRMEEHLQVAGKVKSLLASGQSLNIQLNALASACVETVIAGGKVMFFGNGGSAADAQHWATEFVSRLRVNRPPCAGLALTTDTSALTAIVNDYGVEHMFARQIEAMGRAGDIAVGITTSGTSPNVVVGLNKAKELGIKTAAFTGEDGVGAVKAIELKYLPETTKDNELVDFTIAIPSKVTASIQEFHIVLAHMLCEIVENAWLDFTKLQGDERTARINLAKERAGITK